MDGSGYPERRTILEFARNAKALIGIKKGIGMKRYANEVLVYTKDSEVIIEQPRQFEDSDIITLTPEQISIVIKWLLEARKELVDGKSVA